MDIYFLSADKPIVKRYELDSQGNIVKHPYPFVYDVTSHHEQPTGLSDLCTLMQKYAQQGATMIKGRLARPLIVESRKGSTDPDLSLIHI